MYNLLLTLFLGYEIQKLFQFNLFFRLKCLSIDYKNIFIKKVNSVAVKEFSKVNLMELFYLITLLFGLFSVNLYFLCSILGLASFELFIFKNIKNKLTRKIVFLLTTILSIILLTLSITNLLFANVNGVEFINLIIKYGSNL